MLQKGIPIVANDDLFQKKLHKKQQGEVLNHPIKKK